MANGTDSEEFVLLSQVRTGHNPEFAFAKKAQLEICGSLGRTRSRKTRNEAVATNRSKKLKKLDSKDAENDEVMDQKAKDLGDLGDLMSEEEAKIQNSWPHICHHQIVGTGSEQFQDFCIIYAYRG
ncbi:hypothetical protein SO802_004741 [Lithocarpus litseifolius]|uniref:Uncharacterized protein n=1 Tax=Lithocarpus litseifolius TaxID=425828 RepID=A0AAW2E6I1_9ROSI